MIAFAYTSCLLDPKDSGEVELESGASLVSKFLLWLDHSADVQPTLSFWTRHRDSSQGQGLLSTFKDFAS